MRFHERFKKHRPIPFILLADESCDLTQAEKKITVVKAEQIHKMTIICIQNGQKISLWVKIVVILRICSALTTVIFFSNSKLEQMEWAFIQPKTFVKIEDISCEEK